MAIKVESDLLQRAGAPVQELGAAPAMNTSDKSMPMMSILLF